MWNGFFSHEMVGIAPENSSRIDTSASVGRVQMCLHSIGTWSNQISILWHKYNSIMKRLLKLTQPKRKTNWRNAMVRTHQCQSIEWPVARAHPCSEYDSENNFPDENGWKKEEEKTGKFHWRKRMTHLQPLPATMAMIVQFTATHGCRSWARKVNWNIAFSFPQFKTHFHYLCVIHRIQFKHILRYFTELRICCRLEEFARRTFIFHSFSRSTSRP